MRIALATQAALKMRRYGVFLVLVALSFPALAETQLTPHRAEYKVKISVLGGELSTELKTTPEGYVATHVVKPTGMARMFVRGRIAESSEFARQSDGIRPVRYSSNDTLSRDKTSADISFDWASGEATGTVNNAAFQSLIDGLVYDRVSIQYELMSDLMNGGTAEQYVLFEIDELRTVTVRNIGRRTVKVPAGEFEAIGIQHQKPGSKRVTTLWCVEVLDFLPVMIEQHREGKLKMRAKLRSYSALET